MISENKTANKYQKPIKDIDGNDIGLVDVYSVLSAFDVVEPGLQHAIKKLLMPGQRGKGDYQADLQEAVQAIERAIICHNGMNKRRKTPAPLPNTVEDAERLKQLPLFAEDPRR
jgi:hypothetical protein